MLIEFAITNQTEGGEDTYLIVLHSASGVDENDVKVVIPGFPSIVSECADNTKKHRFAFDLP